MIRRTELDKVEITDSDRPAASPSPSIKSHCWKQKAFLLGILCTLALATVSVYLLRRVIFIPRPHPHRNVALRPDSEGFDPQREILAARGQYDPDSDTYFAAFAFPVRTPREVRVLSLSLGFALNTPAPGAGYGLRKLIPAIRQSIERKLMEPSNRPLLEDVSDHVSQIKNQALIAASGTLREREAPSFPEVRRIFVSDFLFH